MENNENFVVDNDNKAEWCIEKIREHENEYKRLADICMNRIEEYEEKIREYHKKLENETNYMKNQLRQYFETVPHKATKTQETYKLPSGTLKLKYKEKIIKDDDKLLKWLEEGKKEEYIKTVKSANWGDLKKTLQKVDGKYVTEDGEVVEGVTVEDAGAEFSID